MVEGALATFLYFCLVVAWFRVMAWVLEYSLPLGLLLLLLIALLGYRLARRWFAARRLPQPTGVPLTLDPTAEAIARQRFNARQDTQTHNDGIQGSGSVQK